MTFDTNPVAYYARRAREYERIYHTPERLADLAELRVQLPLLLRGRDVLELACGTAYWTQFVALEARTILASDINDEMLVIARQKNYPRRNVSFQQGDAFQPDVTGKFDAGLAVFWFSHVPKQRIDELLQGFHTCLQAGTKVVLVDNRYVEGSSTPISRFDAQGNSYQIRTLGDGSQYEILKNFPTESELRAAVEKYASTIEYRQMTYYWLLIYTLPKL